MIVQYGNIDLARTIANTQRGTLFTCFIFIFIAIPFHSHTKTTHKKIEKKLKNCFLLVDFQIIIKLFMWLSSNFIAILFSKMGRKTIEKPSNCC